MQVHVFKIGDRVQLGSGIFQGPICTIVGVELDKFIVQLPNGMRIVSRGIDLKKVV